MEIKFAVTFEKRRKAQSLKVLLSCSDWQFVAHSVFVAHNPLTRLVLSCRCGRACRSSAVNILFQSRPGRLQHLLLKRVPGSSAVAALHLRKSSEIKPGCSSVQEKKSLRTYLFSNFSYIHGSVHWGARGAVPCLQGHLSASSHQLCPPTGRDGTLLPTPSLLRVESDLPSVQGDLLSPHFP